MTLFSRNEVREGMVFPGVCVRVVGKEGAGEGGGRGRGNVLQCFRYKMIGFIRAFIWGIESF